jgi:hypothetical protein
MTEANKQTALKFLHAMSVGDANGQGECLSPGAFTVEAFNKIVPTGFRPKVEKVVAEGDTVVVEWEGNAVLSNGVPCCNQYVFIFSFEDGKIKQLNEYFCTVLADSTILPLLAEQGPQLAHGNA